MQHKEKEYFIYSIGRKNTKLMQHNGKKPLGMQSFGDKYERNSKKI